METTTTRKQRKHAQASDVVKGSRWLPFICSDRFAGMVTVESDVVAGRVLVRSHKGRQYSTSVETLIGQYYPVRAGEAEVVETASRPSEPAVPVEPEPVEAHVVDPDPEPAPSLACRKVDGWDLFRRASGEEELVRDLDIAARAGLAKPRDVRGTIAKALDDGLIMEVWNTAAAAGDVPRGPVAVAVKERVTIGNGASREVTAYYLNEEAALLLVTRLRTPKAVELTKAIVAVFMAARRGELPADASLEAIKAIGAMMVATTAQLTQAVAVSSARADKLEAKFDLIVERLVDRHPAPSPSQRPWATVEIFIPRDWVGSSDIAKILTGRLRLNVSTRQVDDMIRGLGVRARGETVVRRKPVPKVSDGAVNLLHKWFYAPVAIDELESFLKKSISGAGQASQQDMFGGQR